MTATPPTFCIVIPIYNHHATIGRRIASVLPLQLPIIVVDDGSNEITHKTLVTLKRDHPEVTLLHRDENGGKGAAVMTGLRHAHALGFSHALQIDADLQHSAADAPRLLEAARENPEALVLVDPEYGPEVPRARLFGRQISKGWVWINTLSLAIADPLVGFRIYPLHATLSVLNNTRLSPRMAFDFEILVRLYWWGCPVVNLPSRIAYPEDGFSNFKALRDNVQISLVHAQLFFGMLWRLPRLLFQRGKPKDSPTPWFRLQERGSILGLRFTFAVLRFLGPQVCRPLVFILVVYFFITGKKARQASKDFLKRAGIQPTLGNSFKHFWIFGQAALDKVLVWSGKIMRRDLLWPNREPLEKLLAHKQGAIFFTAHWGNIEIIRALSLSSPGVKVNALMFLKQGANFAAALRWANRQSDFKIIALESISVGTIAQLKECVDRGEFVVVTGDRIAHGAPDRKIATTFFGSPAFFPYGPFLLAELLRCPSFLLFCHRNNRKQYEVYFEPFAHPTADKRHREAAIEANAHRFAKCLEERVRHSPFEWFNFYDFWSTSEPTPARIKPLSLSPQNR